MSRRLPAPGLAALAVLVALFAWPLALHAQAPPPSVRTNLDQASIELPEGWTFQVAPDAEIVGMTARMGVAVSPDTRVVVYLFVIDPFGIDLETWGLADLLGPTLLEMLSAEPEKTTKGMRVRKAECRMAGKVREGRMVIQPGEERDDGLVSGIACGIAEPGRWAAAFIIVEAEYRRPMLLRRSLRQADALLSSFAFE